MGWAAPRCPIPMGSPPFPSPALQHVTSHPPVDGVGAVIVEKLRTGRLWEGGVERGRDEKGPLQTDPLQHSTSHVPREDGTRPAQSRTRSLRLAVRKLKHREGNGQGSDKPRSRGGSTRSPSPYGRGAKQHDLQDGDEIYNWGWTSHSSSAPLRIIWGWHRAEVVVGYGREQQETLTLCSPFLL